MFPITTNDKIVVMGCRGFVAFIPVLVVAAFLAVGGAAYYIGFQKMRKPVENQVAETGPVATLEEVEATPSALPTASVLQPALTSKPKVISSPTPSVSPTPDPVILEACKSAGKRYDYFNGSECYATSDARRLYNAMQGKKSRDDINRMLLYSNQGDIDTKLLNSCVVANKEKYERCTESLNINAGRIQNEFLSGHPGEPASCLEKVSVGAGDEIDLTRDLYWRQKMKDNIGRIYAFCYANGDSLDNFHL